MQINGEQIELIVAENYNDNKEIYGKNYHKKIIELFYEKIEQNIYLNYLCKNNLIHELFIFFKKQQPDDYFKQVNELLIKNPLDDYDIDEVKGVLSMGYPAWRIMYFIMKRNLCNNYDEISLEADKFMTVIFEWIEILNNKQFSLTKNNYENLLLYVELFLVKSNESNKLNESNESNELNYKYSFF